MIVLLHEYRCNIMYKCFVFQWFWVKVKKKFSCPTDCDSWTFRILLSLLTHRIQHESFLLLPQLPAVSSGGPLGRLCWILSLWQHNRSIFHMMAWFTPSAACQPQAEFWGTSGIEQHPFVGCFDRYIFFFCCCSSEKRSWCYSLTILFYSI